MPAVTRNVVATDSPVNASRTNEIVTPVNAEYAMKSIDAVEAARRCTRAERTHTIPSCAMTRPQNSSLLVAMATTTAGEEAIADAVTAVMARPAHIRTFDPDGRSPEIAGISAPV